MNKRTTFSPQRYVPYGKTTNAWKKFLCEGTDPPGLIVKEIDTTIGKGVFAEKKFHIGSFLMEYHGELISEKEAIKREHFYPVELGSYLLYFKSGRSTMCIDATFSTQCGRYVNDGIGEKKNAELKVVYVGTTPHVVLFACRNILKDEEIRYDYGVEDLPWRRKQNSPCSLNEDSLNNSIKECTVLLRKIDTGANTCVYEKEDGTEADVKINRTTHAELEYHTSLVHETLKMRTTEGQQERDGSGKASADKGQSSQMNVSVAQEQDDTMADRTRENPDNEDEEIVFNFRNVSSEEMLQMGTSEGQQDGDGSGIKSSADTGQMNVSVAQEHDDDMADRTRENPDNEDEGIVFNFRNVSSEEKLSRTTKELHKSDESGLKPCSVEGQSSQIIISVAHETDDNIVVGSREKHYNEDGEIVSNFRNGSSEKTLKMRTTEGQQERDGSGKASADKGQFSQMNVSVAQEQDDTMADRTRENPDNENEEIVFNFRNVSSEEMLQMGTTKGQQEGDESGIKSSADKGQSCQMNVSVAQEQDDTMADRTRENPDNEDEEIVFNFRNVSSEEMLQMGTTEGQKEGDGSGIKSSADKGQSSEMNVSVAQEHDDGMADRTRENPDNEDEGIVFNFRKVSSEEALSRTTKDQHKRDEGRLKPFSDEGQFSQIILSVAHEIDDNIDVWSRQKHYNEDGETVFNFRNVSSEKILKMRFTEGQQERDGCGKVSADKGQSSEMNVSVAQEQDDNMAGRTRENPDNEDEELVLNSQNVLSEEEATRLNEANGNDVEDLVHCVIIEDQDAAPITVTEGAIEMTVSNVGREEYTIQQRCVELNPIDHEDLIDSTTHCSKTTPASHATSNSQSKKKPHRPCPYCLCFKSALRKHLIKKHGDKTEVAEALKLPKQDRDRAFLLLKRKGIMMTNMNQLRSEDKTSQALIRERRHKFPNHDVIYCSKCFGFFKKSYFYRHRRGCHLNEKSIYFPHAVQPESSALNNTHEDKFTKEILSSLCNDDVGQICKTENIIVCYGQKKFRKLLTKRNMEKYEDKKINIRNEMRRLGHLFKEFKQICDANKVTCVSFFEMFNPRRFNILEDAIDQVTIKEDGSVKYGLRKDIGYLLKRVCNFLHGKFSVEQNTKDIEQVDSFLNVLTFFWYDIFGEAESSVVFARQTKLRKPSRLPKQIDVKKLRDLMRSTIQELIESDCNFIASSDFIKLRDLVVSRLTLFNARRGGEPCCLLINQWTEAENGDWIGESNEDQDPAKQALLGKYKIAYQTGKNEKLVSLLILDDCWKAVEKLCDPEVRRQAGVHPENTYVFPRINYSLKHVSGWEAVRKCCDLAGLEHAINATDMRHYVATIYAGLEVNETDRETFYNHMGHSESVNRNIYQSPPARQTIIRVGRFLHDIDQETLDNTSGEKESRDGSSNESLADESHSSQIIKTRVQEQDDDTGARGTQVNGVVTNTSKATSDTWRQYRTWTRQDTETVVKYFSSCILSTENIETNKGNLPSIEELKKFLEEFPCILRDFSKQEKIKRLRSKIFNERKLTREKMRKTVRSEKQLSRKEIGAKKCIT